MHAVGDPLVDRVEELVDEDVRRDLLQDAAVGVDEADVATPCNAEVGVARFPRSVDGAAEHSDLEVLRIGVQALLDLLGQVLDADVVAPAARAGDHDWPPLAHAQRLQDLESGLHFLDRVGGQRDPHRVADTVHQQRAHADGALDRAGERRSGLRDT